MHLRFLWVVRLTEKGLWWMWQVNKEIVKIQRVTAPVGQMQLKSLVGAHVVSLPTYPHMYSRMRLSSQFDDPFRKVRWCEDYAVAAHFWRLWHSSSRKKPGAARVPKSSRIGTGTFLSSGNSSPRAKKTHPRPVPSTRKQKLIRWPYSQLKMLSYDPQESHHHPVQLLKELPSRGTFLKAHADTASR